MPNFDLRICYPFTSEPKGKKTNKELQRFACLDDRELDDVVDRTFKQIRQIMQSNAE